MPSGLSDDDFFLLFSELKQRTYTLYCFTPMERTLPPRTRRRGRVAVVGLRVGAAARSRVPEGRAAARARRRQLPVLNILVNPRIDVA